MKNGITFLRFLWGRIPRIALYTVAFYALFWVGHQAFFKFMPSEYFLNYYSTNIPNTEPLYEDEPVPVTFCRHKKANYPITGYRIFYKLPDNGDRTKGVPVANKPISNQITDSNCVDYKIPVEQFDHKQGRYFFRTVINFTVNGNDKQVSNESNTYLVEKKPLSTQDIQLRILELEKEIQSLKTQLSTMKGSNDGN